MLGLFNPIILLLIIHVVLFKVLGGKTPGILSCGLFGYLASADKNNFSWDKFNALGMDNDERGGDSIGRAVGDDIRKFVSKKATTTYKDYVINHKNGEAHHIALGHTRKASVGLISEETAQPVVIDLPNNQGKFIMVHNGTLHNWEDMAKKYGIATFGKTDSMVLGEIICNHGYDVLLEYQGTAALIIRDDRDPDTLKVFRGKSKTWQKVEEERPLFYHQESRNSMYISSREEGLYFIGGDVDTVFEFEPNYLYTIHEGEIISQVVYDRSECSQTKVWTNTTNTYTKKTYAREVYPDNDYEYYSEWQAEANMANKALASAFNKEYNIREEKIVAYNNITRVVCARLRYYFFDHHNRPHLATGMVNMDEYGYRNDGKKEEGEKTYYFYAGIMIKDREAYNDVKKMFGKSAKFVDTDENICRIVQFSAHPICTVENKTPDYSNIRFYNYTYDNAKKDYVFHSCFYSGTHTMLFSNKTYRVAQGICKEITENALSRHANHKVVDTGVTQKELFPAAQTKVIGFTPHPKKEENIFSTKNTGSEETIVKVAEINTEKELDDYIDKMVDKMKEAQTASPFKEEEVVVDAEQEELNKYVLKGLEDGLNAMLTVLDSTIVDVETTGSNSVETNTILANLYKLQDIFIEKEKLTEQTLIVGYDNEF